MRECNYNIYKRILLILYIILKYLDILHINRHIPKTFITLYIVYNMNYKYYNIIIRNIGRY